MDSFDEMISRRDFLQTLGASLALAGLNSCTRMPAEKIIPYVIPPERFIPGEVKYYASTFDFDGYSQGVLVESHEGRPTQVQGNPGHPASLGGSGLHLQASLLSLYDPERSKVVTSRGEIATWEKFESLVRAQSQQWGGKKGEGIRILTGTITSPTLGALIGTFLKRYPRARWHAYQPIHLDRQKEAGRIAFGKELLPIYRFENAKIILSLNADFLGPGPAQLAYARGYGLRRDPDSKRNRLYVVEGSPSITGAMADHLLRARPSRMKQIALFVARELGLRGLSSDAIVDDSEKKWLQSVVDDFRRHPRESVVVVSPQDEVETQVLAHAINERLGAFGGAIHLIASPEESPPRHEQSIAQLVADMQSGKVSTLFSSGCNPVYSAPSGLQFSEALKKVALKIHHGQEFDETASACDWHLPASHELEAWGDGRAFDGTVSFHQPLIAPMYDTKTFNEIMAVLNGNYGATSQSLLKDHWRERWRERVAFEDGFERAIEGGFISETAFRSERAVFRSGAISEIARGLSNKTSDGIELCFLPDPTIWDGRYAGNAWLQELPKPIFQLTWCNVALVSPETADKLGLEDEDVVSVEIGGRKTEAPVLRVPGQADSSVTLFFGYGRKRAGPVGTDRGYDAFSLLDRSVPLFQADARIHRTGRKRALALVHEHHSMERRDLVRHGSLSDYLTNPQKLVPPPSKQATLVNAKLPRAEEAWAMVIDLNRCIGCKSCVIACQAENNIPVVGEREVRRGREMHWIRVDRYYETRHKHSTTLFQPVPCMHCETAPCEYVCPTAATNHSSDGLNQMVYNRCVGTRYCSNNCPYKVRRFNFLQYSDFKSSSVTMMKNPEVTLRSRGVMEKCTYCIQRIQRARIEAEKRNLPIRDGEIITACQQACPTRAIHFGDLADSSSEVARLRKSGRNYSLLEELGTRPRTTYLVRISHPNATLEHETGGEA